MPLEWIALNSVKGLGPVRIARCIERFKSPGAVLAAPAGEISRTCGVPLDIAVEIRNPALMEFAREQLDAATACGARVLTLEDPSYPAMLREIFAPPPVLYVKGHPEALNNHAFAIVGTRQPTPYGRQAAATLAGGLAGRGVTIVSGLALGIDAVSHQACIDNGGVTVAVLGSGIDSVYPATNRDLARQIVERGALVSEFPLKTRPEAYNFPRRNRIISGLSAGVLVVEAGIKSGSLITVGYALQQNRDVFAVPGPIFSDKSNGTFTLLKNGATPVRSVDDIIEQIQAVRAPNLFSSVTQPVTAALVETLLSDQEKKICTLLSGKPLRVDEIAEESKIEMGGLFDLLLNLELKGAVRQEPGQLYVKV